MTGSVELQTKFVLTNMESLSVKFTEIAGTYTYIEYICKISKNAFEIEYNECIFTYVEPHENYQRLGKFGHVVFHSYQAFKEFVKHQILDK